MPSLNAALKVVAICCAVIVINNCGGGSSSKNVISGSKNIVGDGSWQSGVFYSADNYINKCAAPRVGVDLRTKRSYPDMPGTFAEENNFLRSWSNDTYLWYEEIVDQDPSTFLSPKNYFATLKTNAKTASDKYKDNYHFTADTEVWDGLIHSGVDTGYGISWAWLKDHIPRDFVIAYTEPGSPAADGNLKRGAKLLKVDGVDFIYGDDLNAINSGLFPTAHNETHSLEVLDYGSSVPRTILLTSGPILKVPVQNVTITNTASGNVGYFLFNDHLATAEQGLIDAVNQLKQANITDLVLDVRYNSGGFLYIASELAYMIAGNQATYDKVFEKTVFNNKYTTVGLNGESLDPMGFYNTSDAGDSLPSLNLPRVFIITSGATCSASEAIINGLRGVDIEVIQIGSTTCGKPYGFYPQDNCGTSYFSIQFKGINNKGFGEYADGFIPSAQDNGLDNIKGCKTGDDFSHALGSPAELNLAAALYYRDWDRCPQSSEPYAIKLHKLSGEDYRDVHAILNKEPGLSNRIMR